MFIFKPETASIKVRCIIYFHYDEKHSDLRLRTLPF
jgi:hypothetical protein